MNTIPVIPRIEDLPYHTSPPIQFVFQQTAALTGGVYTWSGLKAVLTPNRPLMPQAQYYFRSATLSADLDELDFTSNITVTPKFQLYLKSNANVILFREPILMVKYLQNYDFRLTWNTKMVNDQLTGSFTGTIVQGASMLGKMSITLTAIVSCQEIIDDQFISLFKERYPVGGQGI